MNIVRKEAVNQFIKSVGKAYEDKTGRRAEFYVVDIGDGAGRREEINYAG